MSRKILPASCPQRQGNHRGDVPTTRWGRWAFLRSHVLDRGAQAGAQTVACGDEAAASGEEHSADEQRSRVNISSFMSTEAR
jgi:hypothetical protein